MTDKLLCPKCKALLNRDGGRMLCKAGHSYDIASEGYVNLALGKSGSGDSREMCRARRDFLSKDYYKPLADSVSEQIITYTLELGGIICDAGCGEGYYLRNIRNTHQVSHPANDGISYIGFDLAKDSVRFAAKAEKNQENKISYAVSGIFDMPLPDESCSAVISVFAPIPTDEAKRVLKKGGVLIIAGPGEHHLSGLKKILYDRPYDNEEKELKWDCFELVSVIPTQYTAFIQKEDIKNLFMMTPYYWKTSKEDTERLYEHDGFDTILDFKVSVFKKI